MSHSYREIYSDDRGNRVFSVLNQDFESCNGRIIFNGENNTIFVHEVNNGFEVEFTSMHGIAVIGKRLRVKGKIRIGYYSLIMIGDDVSSTNPSYLCSSEQTQILIGDDCMLATNVHVRTDDGHAIYDVETDLRLNKSRDIIIGAHTWIAYASKVYGGSIVGDGSIIGANSFVKGKYPNNCIIVGTPSRIVRRNIAWERPNVATTEPWIRNDASEIKKTKEFWRKTDDYQKVPNLGRSCVLSYELLKQYCPESAWIVDNYGLS